MRTLIARFAWNWRLHLLRNNLLLVLFFLVIGLTACTTAWVGEAQQIIAELGPAITIILNLLAAFGVTKISAADIQFVTSQAAAVTSDLTLVGQMIDQYNAAAAADQPTILAKIDDVLKTIQGNLNAILPGLHIVDAAVQAKVEAVVGAVIAEVETLKGFIPVLQGTVAISSIAHIPLTGRQFRSQFNRVLRMRTGDASVDTITAQLQL